MSDRVGSIAAPQTHGGDPPAAGDAPAPAPAPAKRKPERTLEPRDSTGAAGESAAARPRTVLPVPARARPHRPRPPAPGPRPHTASPVAHDEAHATPAVQPTARAQELNLNPLATAPRAADVDLALRLRHERLVELLSSQKLRNEPRSTHGRLVDRILQALGRDRS